MTGANHGKYGDSHDIHLISAPAKSGKYRGCPPILIPFGAVYLGGPNLVTVANKS